MGRSRAAMRNAGSVAFGQLVTSAIGFATRTVFIHTLGATYLGLHGLFTNVLSVLSFAELGIGTAMTFALYGPLVRGDHDGVAALMHLFAKAYRVVALVVAGTGTLLAPFLPFLMKDDPGVPNLYLLYFVFLLNSVLSYPLSYTRSLLIASENGHLEVRNRVGFLLVQNGCQIAALYALPNYMLYLVAQLLFQVASNVAVTVRVHRMFPGILFRKDQAVQPEVFAALKRNVSGMIFHKFGSAAVSTSTTLFISAFVGVIAVAKYSNYVLITGIIGSVIAQGIAAAGPSVGKLSVDAPVDTMRTTFSRMLFLNIALIGLATAGFAVLLDPFVGLWAGPQYVFEPQITALIVLNFFLYGLRQTAITFINSLGLFWEIRYKSLAEALITIVASALLLIVFDLGVFGALLSVTVSTLMTNIWWEPLVVWRKLDAGLSQYFRLILRYSATTAVAVCLSVAVGRATTLGGFLGLVVDGSATAMIVILVFIGFHWRDSNMAYAVGLARRGWSRIVHSRYHGRR